MASHKVSCGCVSQTPLHEPPQLRRSTGPKHLFPSPLFPDLPVTLQGNHHPSASPSFLSQSLSSLCCRFQTFLTVMSWAWLRYPLHTFALCPSRGALLCTFNTAED